MDVKCFTVGMFQVNTYLISDPQTGDSAIVDTGETDELVHRIKALDSQPDLQMILLTHTHLDHAGALSMVQEAWDLPGRLRAGGDQSGLGSSSRAQAPGSTLIPGFYSPFVRRDLTSRSSRKSF